MAISYFKTHDSTSIVPYWAKGKRERWRAEENKKQGNEDLEEILAGYKICKSVFLILQRQQYWICLPQMRTINISSLRCKLHTVPPSVLPISQSLAEQSSMAQLEQQKRKEQPPERICLMQGTPRGGRYKRGIVPGWCLQEAGDRENSSAFACEHLLWGTEHCFSSPRWHWRVKGATEQITGAAVSGREERRTSMNHQGIRANETRK